MSWTWHHEVGEPVTQYWDGQHGASTQTITGPAHVTPVSLVIDNEAALEAFFAANCDGHHVTGSLGNGPYIGTSLDTSTGQLRNPAGTPGAIAAGVPVNLHMTVGCYDRDTDSYVPVPDFVATATFAVTYLEPSNVRQLN